jgi:hypothetical protein
MVVRSRRGTRDQKASSEPTQRGGGEQIDGAAGESIRLAHRALNRFPDLLRRHRYVAGGAAVAGALVVLASVAIARRMRNGESGEEAADSVTQAEIESLHPRERGETEPEVGTEPATAGAYRPYVPSSNGASTNGARAGSAEGHARES